MPGGQVDVLYLDVIARLDTLERSLRGIENAAGESGRRAGTAFGQQFTQDAHGRWHDLQGRYVSDSRILGQLAGQEAGRSFGHSFQNSAVDSSQKFALILSGITAGAGTAGLALIKMAGEAEQAQESFITLLGSAEKAKTFYADLVNFAAQTPFELNGLQDSARRLLAFGFNSEQILPMLTAVGNAVGSLGGSKDVLDGVTLALGQMQAKGKVSAEEMNQLAERGISAWQMLADKLGIAIPEAMKRAERGMISSAEAIPAILQGMEDKFSGGMERQSKTLLGMWSNTTDLLKQAGAAAGQSIIDALDLKGKLSGFNKFIEGLPALIQQIDLRDWAADNATAIALVAGGITGALVPALIAGASAVVGFVTPLLPFVAAGAAITLVLKSMGISLDDIQQGFNKAKAAAEPILRTLSEIGEVVSKKVSPVFDYLAETVQGAIEIIKNVIERVLMPIFAAIAPHVRPILESVGELIDEMAHVVSDSVRNIGTVIDRVLLPAFEAIWPVVKPVLDAVMGGAKILLNTLTGIFRSLRAVLNADWKAAWEEIKKTALSAAHAIGPLLSKAWDGVKTAGLNLGKKLLEGLMSGIHNLESLLLGAISKALSVTAQKLPAVMRGPFQAAADAATEAALAKRNAAARISMNTYKGIGPQVGGSGIDMSTIAVESGKFGYAYISKLKDVFRHDTRVGSDCAIIAYEILKKLGIGIKGSAVHNAWTPNLEKNAKAGGFNQVGLKNAKPGDLIIFKSGGGVTYGAGSGMHAGVVAGWKNGKLQVIDNPGSDANGRDRMTRVRNIGVDASHATFYRSPQSPFAQPMIQQTKPEITPKLDFKALFGKAPAESKGRGPITAEQIRKAKELLATLEAAKRARDPKSIDVATQKLKKWGEISAENARAIKSVEESQKGLNKTERGYLVTKADLQKYGNKALRLIKDQAEAERLGSAERIRATKNAVEAFAKEGEAKKGVLELERQAYEARNDARKKSQVENTEIVQKAKQRAEAELEFQRRISADITAKRVANAKESLNKLKKLQADELNDHGQTASQRLAIHQKTTGGILAAEKRINAAVRSEAVKAAEEEAKRKLLEGKLNANNVEKERKRQVVAAYTAEAKANKMAQDEQLRILRDAGKAKNEEIEVNTRERNQIELGMQKEAARETVAMHADELAKLKGNAARKLAVVKEQAEEEYNERLKIAERERDLQKEANKGVPNQAIKNKAADQTYNRAVSEAARERNRRIEEATQGVAEEAKQVQALISKYANLRKEQERQAKEGRFNQEVFNKTLAEFYKEAGNMGIANDKLIKDAHQKAKAWGDVAEAISRSVATEADYQRAIQGIEKYGTGLEKTKVDADELAARMIELRRELGNSEVATAWSEELERLRRAGELTVPELNMLLAILDDLSASAVSTPLLPDHLQGRGVGDVRLAPDDPATGALASGEATALLENFQNETAVFYRSTANESAGMLKKLLNGAAQAREMLSNLEFETDPNKLLGMSVDIAKFLESDLGNTLPSSVKTALLNGVKDAEDFRQTLLNMTKSGITDGWERGMAELEVPTNRFEELKASLLSMSGEFDDPQVVKGVTETVDEARKNGELKVKQHKVLIDLIHGEIDAVQQLTGVTFEARAAALERARATGKISETAYLQAKEQLAIEQENARFELETKDKLGTAKKLAEKEHQKRIAAIKYESEQESIKLSERLQDQTEDSRQKREIAALEARKNKGLLSEVEYLKAKERLDIQAAQAEFTRKIRGKNEADIEYIAAQNDLEGKLTTITRQGERQRKQVVERLARDRSVLKAKIERAALDSQYKSGLISDVEYQKAKEQLAKYGAEEEFKQRTNGMKVGSDEYKLEYAKHEQQLSEIAQKGIDERRQLEMAGWQSGLNGMRQMARSLGSIFGSFGLESVGKLSSDVGALFDTIGKGKTALDAIGPSFKKSFGTGLGAVSGFVGVVGEAINVIGNIGNAIMNLSPSYREWKSSMLEIAKAAEQTSSATTGMIKNVYSELLKQDAKNRETIANAGFWQNVGWALFGGKPEVMAEETAKFTIESAKIFNEMANKISGSLESALMNAFEQDDWEGAAEALEKSLNSMIAKMSLQALISTSGIEKQIQAYAEARAKALEDGVITGDEQNFLGRLLQNIRHAQKDVLANWKAIASELDGLGQNKKPTTVANVPSGSIMARQKELQELQDKFNKASSDAERQRLRDKVSRLQEQIKMMQDGPKSTTGSTTNTDIGKNTVRSVQVSGTIAASVNFDVLSTLANVVERAAPKIEHGGQAIFDGSGRWLAGVDRLERILSAAEMRPNLRAERGL